MPDCLICFQPFDTMNRIPKILNCDCKTTVCQMCLEIFTAPPAICPFDKNPLKGNTIESYSTDQAILEELVKTGESPQECESETQKRHSLVEKKERKLKECENKKKIAYQQIDKLTENMIKTLKKKSNSKEEVHDWTLEGLEIYEKKLKVQACFREDLNNIAQQEFIEGNSPQLNLRIDGALASLTKDLEISEENYRNRFASLGFRPFKARQQENSSLLKQKINAVSQLIQIIQERDFIGIKPKDFGTGSEDILRDIEIWKNAKKVVIYFKKDRINQEVLQAMAAVFEEFVNVTDVKLDLRNQNITDNELSLLFERQFWQKSSVQEFSLDMENSRAHSSTLTAILSKITVDMPQLSSLNVWMHGTLISGEGLEALGKHTLAPLTHLKQFGLIVFQCKAISDAGFYLLFPSLIEPLKNLTSFALSLNDNPQLTNEALVFFFKTCLKDLAELENVHFSLAGTKLNDFGLWQISEILKESLQNIKGFELFLNRTEITDFGAQLFIKTVLPKLSKAQALNLSFHKTRIGDTTMTALLDTITSTLKDLQGVRLNLTYNNVSNGALLKYNCKNFCSMKKIQFFEFFTHGGCRTSDALLGFKLKVQKESAENSSKFKFWPEN